MKRIFLLLAAICSLSTAMWADAYQFKVMGNEVNQSNAADILGDGQLRYVERTQTLYVVDLAIFESYGAPFLEIGNQDLNIVFEGSADIQSNASEVITAKFTEAHKVTMMLKGPYVEFSTGADDGAVVDLGNLCELTLNGSGTYYFTQTSAHVPTACVLSAGHVNLNAPLELSCKYGNSEHDVYAGMLEVTMNPGLEIKTPNVTYNEHGYFQKTGSNIISEFSIEAKQFAELELYVGGVMVNQANKDDVLSDGGHVVFDANTYELHIYNAVIEVEGCTGIERKSDAQLIINVHGHCEVHTTRQDAIVAKKGIAIQGIGSDASLSIVVDGGGSSYGFAAIYTPTATAQGIRIAYAAVEAKVVNAGAVRPAICCAGDPTNTTLVIEHADLRASVESPLPDFDSRPELVAIACGELELIGSNVKIRHDEIWNDVQWADHEFTGTARHHIWIGEKEVFPMGIEQMSMTASRLAPRKVLRDGQLLIVAGEQVYNVSGMKIQ